MSIHFSLMTYNVHSCVGTDRKTSPERIAGVIAHYSPDIVALQELDVELFRSGMIDQAKEIADRLNMHFHFHPSFRLEKGYFGNAILSRYPMRLVKADGLPAFRHRQLLEKRGAIWTEAQVDGVKINLINTHLGLNRKERQEQIDMLLGPEWMSNPACRIPVLLCGDLNASPLSGVYRKIKTKLHDVQKRINGSRPQSTWPSRFPLMRIDHIFVSSDIVVTETSVPRTTLTQSASDHLPLVAHIKIS